MNLENEASTQYSVMKRFGEVTGKFGLIFYQIL
jgi:hypothetical protein